MRERRAFVALAALALIVAAASLFWNAHQVSTDNAHWHQALAAQQRQAAEQQAAQERQGAVIEQRLCTSLGKLAALKPPAGNPAVNPARGFDQQEHAVLAQLGPDVGCRP